MHTESRLLIVDDIPDNIQIAMNILKEENYSFSFASDGVEALKLINAEHFDLILLDVMMPNMDGFTVCEELQKNPKLSHIPVIFLTAKSDIDSVTHGFGVGGIDYIVKPFHADELIARVKTHLELAQAKNLLHKNNIDLHTKSKLERNRLLNEIENNQHDMVCVLMEIMEETSDETGQHIKRVAEYSRLLARHTKSLTERDEVIIFHAAPMHDIGKMAIPGHILNKPSRLTEEEFEIIKTHTTAAKKYLTNSPRALLSSALIIATQHHEKWNGMGYPKGLKGHEIHIYGRIVALADVFDALTHNRQYKKGWSIEAAVEYIKDHRGTQFDPELVDIFIEHLPEFIDIMNQ